MPIESMIKRDVWIERCVWKDSYRIQKTNQETEINACPEPYEREGCNRCDGYNQRCEKYFPSQK